MYRIFIVEDDRTIAQAVAHLAESWGLEVRCVRDFRAVTAEAADPEFRVVRPAVAFPDGMTVGEHGALSVPTRTGMDGFFLCAMQKTQ